MYPKADASVSLAGSPAGGQRWVVVHDAERDHYELPIALAEIGKLERFVTDWYSPLDRPLWRWFAKTGIAKSAFGISKRYRSELPSRLIADNKVAFVAALARRKFLHKFMLDEVVGGATGRYAAAIANRHNTPVLAASYCAATAFEAMRNDLRRVLFQVHPHPRFLRALYSAQMAKSEDFAGLVNEPEAAASEEDLSKWEQESRLADQILCASAFTRRSLVESGIPANKISVIPYGVDTQTFQFGEPTANAPLKALFVGQKVARKGLRMLLRVWQELQPVNAQLVLAGGHVRDEAVMAGYEQVFTETPRVGMAELVWTFQQADVLVLPSIAEGFGHVYLEALSCGVPVICTENTGAADIIQHGESGWVLPAGDAAALADCLSWITAHRGQLRDMRGAARAVAEKYSWPHFREGVRNALLSPSAEGWSESNQEARYGMAASSKSFA